MSQRVAEDCGITYRQLDHWTRQGYLRPIQRDAGGNDVTGQGHHRFWPARELDVARAMGVLVRAGLEPAAAHEAAREGRTERVLEALGKKS